jgi:hypothetical protein
MIRDKPVEEPDTESGTPALIDFARRRTHAGASDVNMRPRRAIDETL